MHACPRCGRTIRALANRPNVWETEHERDFPWIVVHSHEMRGSSRCRLSTAEVFTLQSAPPEPLQKSA